MVFIHITACLGAQTSPFSTGKWAKIAVQKQGIAKLTGAQIKALGFTLPIVSNNLQLYHFNSQQLLELVPAIPEMGLQENAIQVVDGGDGKIDEGDYVLFYNVGNHIWTYDSTTQGVKHQKLQNAQAIVFFLTIGSNGKRVRTQNASSTATQTITKFTQHFMYEVDSISLLNSGKIFWGIPMGQGTGKQNQISIPFSTPYMTSTSQFKSNVHMASTSYQTNGQFDFSWNNQLVHSSSLPPVTGFLFDDIASEKLDSFSSTTTNNWPLRSIFTIHFNGSNTATGWIDYIEFEVLKNIGFGQDSTLAFSMEAGFTPGENAICQVQNVDANTLVWNVTHPENPQAIQLQVDGNGLGSFYQKTDSMQSFFGVKQSSFETPILLGEVPNQNTLTNRSAAEYIIVAAPAYMLAAQKYQAFQQTQLGRQTEVVNAVELYNDFSGAQVSPIAIRNFLKLRWNQANLLHQKAPAYLLLLGMGNFNCQQLNVNNELPVYESENSISILSSYSTDDFFAVLNTNENINDLSKSNLSTLSVGRIPARTVQEADTAIEKLIHYQTQSKPGSWANRLTWIADDGDYNLHLQDAESIVANLKAKENKWASKKIYLDLFPAVSSTSGNTYPLANAALQQAVQEGSLMLNYTGHGNYLRLAEEAVISQEMINAWDNANHLPLLVTASCNFAPYDQPHLQSIAWDAFMKNGKGVMGVVAANRLVFAYSNKQINDLFIQQLLVADSFGKYNSIGKALSNAKLANQGLGGDRINAYKFNLIGDPGLQLVAPQYELTINKINQLPAQQVDSLLLGIKHTIQGEVQNGGQIKTDFNGIVELTVYDAIQWKKTLANQSSSMSVPIALQENILYKGTASIVHGEFSLDFILPTQTNNINSPIRIQIVAMSDAGNTAALKVRDSIFVKQSYFNNHTDTIGPSIYSYFNNKRFQQGDWVGANGTIYIQLKDSSGIQISGNALGQDLTLWLDALPLPIMLNNYFIADVNTYQSGQLQYSFSNLSEGKHIAIIKAWDLVGNMSADTIRFEVAKNNYLTIKNTYVYPNPFRDYAKFCVETNLTNLPLQIELSVFDSMGKLLHTQSSSFVNMNNIIELTWDGITDAGKVLLPGVYNYQFKMNHDGKQAQKAGHFIKY
jgi:hypothetical protein